MRLGYPLLTETCFICGALFNPKTIIYYHSIVSGLEAYELGSHHQHLSASGFDKLSDRDKRRYFASERRARDARLKALSGPPSKRETPHYWATAWIPGVGVSAHLWNANTNPTLAACGVATNKYPNTSYPETTRVCEVCQVIELAGHYNQETTTRQDKDEDND